MSNKGIEMHIQCQLSLDGPPRLNEPHKRNTTQVPEQNFTLFSWTHVNAMAVISS